MEIQLIKFMEDKRHTIYSDKIELHVIELPKLPKELKGNSSDLLLWAKFLNAEKEEFETLAKKNLYIGKAYDKLQVISMDKKKQLEYTARQKAILDYNQLMKEFTEAGREEGRREGEELGLKKGEELGMVYAYYDMNLDTKEIAQKMQLTEGEVTDIIRNREMDKKVNK